jgi:hypothetical protein
VPGTEYGASFLLEIDWIPSEDTMAASPGPWEWEAAREGRVMARRPISCPPSFRGRSRISLAGKLERREIEYHEVL